MGICFRNSLLGKCLETFFYVYKSDNDSKLEGYKDGLITKKFSACANDDNLEYPEAMEIIFPDDAKVEDKFLLLCVGVMIDYLFYNTNPNELKEN